MRKLLLILFLWPWPVFGYTEFYCDASNGSNLYSGSTTNASPYTKTAGNYVSATRVYTVQDGTNPSLSVNVGDYASVYADGASAPTGWVSQVTAVQNATNGTITMSGIIKIGNSPADGTGNRTIVVGGPWKGPNAASGFPFTTSTLSGLQTTATNRLRINMKNNATYSITSAYTPSTSGSAYTVQGYSSTVGDGGRATISGGTSTNTVLSGLGIGGTVYADLIFTTTFASSSSDLVTAGNQSVTFYRCVFSGSRGNGFNSATAGTYVFIECEAFGNNTSNTSSKAGFTNSTPAFYSRCYSHDNTGSNSSGWIVGAGGTMFISCIADTNGKFGISFNTGGPTSPGFFVSNCDFYNNGSDGINIASADGANYWIENSNFIKNGGAGINNASTTTESGYVFNCGYGAGTQANTNADTLGELIKTGTVTYASNVTPWVAPTTGNFSLDTTVTSGLGAGRGAFTETDGTNTGTVGYPDIGAAQAITSDATPTPTPTPTTPPETSHTFGG